MLSLVAQETVNPQGKREREREGERERHWDPSSDVTRVLY